MKCFHHNDADGRCAAAIVFKARPDAVPTDFIEVDYKDMPDFGKLVKPNEEVFIVDFSFKPPQMEQLQTITENIHWIDHHATAASYGYSSTVKGLQDFANKGQSGCELTWAYLFPSDSTPVLVRLVGDYDAWRLLDPRSLMFHEGLKLKDTAPCSKMMATMLSLDICDNTTASALIAGTLDAGSACLKYRDAYCAEMRKMVGYETTIANVKAYAINVYRFGSAVAGDLVDKYPIIISYVFDGEKYTVSLYSTNPDIHCGEICKQFGGGGHKGAAGFICTVLPFIRT